MVTARNTHGVAMLDGKLYAVGGYDDVGWLSSVDRYDPATNAWEAVAPMGRGCRLPRPQLGRAVRPAALDAWEAVVPMATARAAFPLAFV